MSTNTSTYDAPFTVAAFNDVPRFGHSDNLAGVASSQEPWQDYAEGTIFIGAFILAVFVAWVILTGLFYFCGQKRVGILSGKRLREEDKTAMHGVYRGMVVVSCVLTVMAGMIYFVKVSSSLNDCFGVVRIGVGDIVRMADNVTSVADDIIKAGEDTIPVRNDVVILLEDGICSSFTGGNGNTIDFDQEALGVIEQLKDLSDFTSGELTDLRNSFHLEFKNIQIEVNLVVDEAENYARASYYALVVMFLASLLSLGAYMAWFGPKFRAYFFAQSWIILPLYFLVLITTAIMAAAIGSAMVVNSDLCLGGEHSNPESFAKYIVDSLDLVEYPQQIIDFYVLNSCAGEFVGYESVDQLVNDLEDGDQAVIDLRTLLEDNQKDFETRCGGAEGSLDGLKSSLTAIDNAFASFVSIGRDTRNLLECEPINQMYKDLYHEGVCRKMPNTMFWMFVTMLLVLFFGMIIISLRGALVPGVLDDEPDNYYYSNYSKKTETAEEPSQIIADKANKTKEVGNKDGKDKLKKKDEEDEEEDDGPLVICGQDLVC